jgi:hypothetical protein
VIGILEVYKDNIFEKCFATLEQHWNDNKISDSCIPKGKYKVDRHNSQKYPDTFILRDTEPRSAILIHSGNYYTHTKGCILLGMTHDDINNDGYIDVSQSKSALSKLNKICKNETIINIIIE